ncbi:P-loop NTPase fold protein [Clostridium estertheticum]|uniref:P-loop NTPase fold protein n=1 Tax=Clostridium estertheticum TaxID=238834 RepID=UPI001C0DE3DC|nr:P-loop NTPase fold protein [Clostridium estertheticum]MBU3073871.1 KAP family NTPase [Clostridium estertheticum]MBU3163966.1 KAP family NTPase [Clostridium estertheticum]
MKAHIIRGGSIINNLQAAKALDRVFNSEATTFKNTSCIFIDGAWGIGKTYFIQNYFSENESEFELVYVSVFGKNFVRDIEKSILIHSLPGLSKFNEDNGFIKVAKTFFNDMSGKFLGVSIDNYINSFSIEDIKWDTDSKKRKIICFDDIERKSESIEMKNLLGLIERASRNFDVLIIGNSEELNEIDGKILNKYKEKVIDHVFKIHTIDRSTLICILKSMKLEHRNEIIDVYLSDNVDFGKALSSKKSFLKNKIYNLRVFIKYVELILRLEKYLDSYKIGEDILKICKAVIYDYYFFDKDEKKNPINFDKFNIYKTINKILLNEDIEKDDFKEYFVDNSEVREDIKSIYNAYRLSEIDFKNLIKKIKIKMQHKDLKYLKKQENVISLVSALNESKMIDADIIKKMLETAVDLYSPEENIPYTKIDYLQWSNVDNYGNEIQCDKTIQLFIEKINQKCTEKFQHFINDKIEEIRSTKNYEELLILYNFNQINRIEEFEDIFDYYFNQLVVKYSNDISQKISNLISKTNSGLISTFFTNRIKNETQITKIKKYEMFDFELERKMQYESEEEYYRNNPPEEPE